jgi:hypothetical protein
VASWPARLTKQDSNDAPASSLDSQPIAVGEYQLVEVKYRGQVEKHEEFFAQPWLPTLPNEVVERCYDAILIDAPMGFQPLHPGRMEASFFAVQNARRCLASGEKRAVYVFLHDVARHVERDIIEHYFSAYHQLFELPGKRGILIGWWMFYF